MNLRTPGGCRAGREDTAPEGTASTALLLPLAPAAPSRHRRLRERIVPSVQEGGQAQPEPREANRHLGIFEGELEAFVQQVLSKRPVLLPFPLFHFPRLSFHTTEYRAKRELQRVA